MAPLRGIKKKRKVENNEEEEEEEEEEEGEDNSLVSGSSQKDGSAKWWDALSKKIAGNPDDFKSTFNMSRKTFDYICSLVKDHMTAKTHFAFINGKSMSLHDQVALALRRLGTGNSLISIGESFGAHHSTVSQVTWRFVEAIEQRGTHHIQWPTTNQELTEIKRKFEKIRGLPNCCGAIDTTHITMLLTSSDREADSWVDRKGAHSMVLQAVVDPDLRFRDIVTGWPGKMTDSSVLENSTFFQLCQNGERLKKSEQDEEEKITEYIIGDYGFPLLPWLITPYQGKQLTETKTEFNQRVIATHLVAEKALTRLKEGWRMIRGDMWRPDKHKLPRFIFVCCILHNIVIDMSEEGDDDDVGELTCSVDHDPGYRQEVCEAVDKNGSALRDELCAYFSGR